LYKRSDIRGVGHTQLSALLNSTADTYSPLSGRQLVARKVSELVVMGGGYPSGKRSWNFRGSKNASLAAHAIDSWPEGGRVTFLGDDVGKKVLSGKPLMNTQGLEGDPVRKAYIYYAYFNPRPSWDPLAVLYAIHGLGDLFEFGNVYGYNRVEPDDGTNHWVWDEGVKTQHFLRLRVDEEVAAAEVDRLFLRGALSAVAGQHGLRREGGLPCSTCGHAEL
jgi:hypothetical protein